MIQKYNRPRGAGGCSGIQSWNTRSWGCIPPALLCPLAQLQLPSGRRRLDLPHRHIHVRLHGQISSPLVAQEGRNESSFMAGEL